MTQSQFDQLLENHRTGTATKEDEALLESWYLQYGRRPSELRIKEVELAEIEMRQYIFKHIQDKPNLYLKNRLKIATWAAAVLLITVGFLYYNTPFFGNSAHKNAVKQQENEVLPGKNTATLTLANGKSISLSEAKTGIHFEDSKLSYNDHTSVFKSDSRHKNSENEQNLDEISLSGKIEMLTATTPKGGTYQVVLSDGTKIWLNAETKISFPSRFPENERKIVLDGEAYFEVAKVFSKQFKKTKSRALPPRVPFLVESKGQVVEVLGTHFNINSYQNEASVRTTLLEGSVKVAVDKFTPSRAHKPNGEILVPGQQAVVSANHTLTIKQADLEATVAWKNGKFTFDREDLGSIMRKVSRWYNVEVVFDDNIQDKEITGSVSRFANLSELLTILERTGRATFEISGRRVIVTK